MALKTTGHEKSHLTVILAAKADGTKLKPYIVFKGAVREVARMQKCKRCDCNFSEWLDERQPDIRLATVSRREIQFHPTAPSLGCIAMPHQRRH